jgi:hypothetical protein
MLREVYRPHHLRKTIGFFVALSPSDLAALAFRAGDTYVEEMAIYTSKWITTKIIFGPSPRKICINAIQCIINVHDAARPSIHMSFDSKFEKYILATPFQTYVNVNCQIKEIKPLEFFGENCEIIP